MSTSRPLRHLQLRLRCRRQHRPQRHRCRGQHPQRRPHHLSEHQQRHQRFPPTSAMLTKKITARLFGSAFLFSMLLCRSNTLNAQDSLLLRDYRYVQQSSPWFTQRNAAALALYNSRNIAEADLSLSHASGSLTGFSGSPSAHEQWSLAASATTTCRATT